MESYKTSVPKQEVELVVTLSKNVQGYWDGGPKSKFVFNEDFRYSDGLSRVGSWGANGNKLVRTGKTQKQTLSRIKASIRKWAKRIGTTCEFEWKNCNQF